MVKVGGCVNQEVFHPISTGLFYLAAALGGGGGGRVEPTPFHKI